MAGSQYRERPKLSAPAFLLTSALALLGRIDQARAAMQTGRALSADFTIRRFRNNVSSNDPTYVTQRKRIIEGMRLAGVPEG